jgi:hypothetical protein
LYPPENDPQQNLAILAANPYPGRLLVVGFVDDIAVQAYAIGGRSEGSRNRILVLEDGIISTQIFDKTKPNTSPELTIYDAMRRTGSTHIVSNGDQTMTAIQYLRSCMSFEEAMNVRTYEPDEPNFTARISGFIEIKPTETHPRLGLSLISKAPDSDQPVRTFYTENSSEIQLESGIGYALHTYTGNGSPLPPFIEAPFRLPILPDPKAMAELLWEHLDDSTRIAVAAKTITPDGQVDFYIRNAHQS